MQLQKCDRCGAINELDDNDLRVDVGEHYSGPLADCHLELCDKCITELVRFLAKRNTLDVI